MDAFLAGLADQFGPLLLLLGGVFAFAESALGLGLAFPGETAVLALGAATTTGADVAWALGVVAVGASLGDHVGYLIGRKLGPALRESALVRRIGVRHWDAGSRMMGTYGTWAIAGSRLLPGVRTVVPAVAGAAGVTYRSFVLGSLLGAASWSGLWVGAGATARTALPEMARTLGTAGWIAVGVLALAAVVAVLVVRHRRNSREKALR
ncbi:DedA family protein [Ruania alba]|uniref:Membrane protein DedA, SNARE-associated domain n=1 Tax=Ruania alba TaxID=648782 RepID=A0A1H5EF38_9MICO|nr:DedA family protein [Ruania alba]SED89606.1 membrane protein DedA, SNARE-associated domain [Ruania alba]